MTVNPAVGPAGWQVQCYQGSLFAYGTEAGPGRSSGSFVHILNTIYTDKSMSTPVTLAPTGSEIYSASFGCIGVEGLSTDQSGVFRVSNMPTKGKVISLGKSP